MYNTLISADDLRDHYLSEHWRILDCRFRLNDTDAGRRMYEAGHLPGALYVHLDNDLSERVVPGITGRHPLPSPDDAAALFSRLGIDDQTQVVAYDDAGGAIAARVWWMLQWLGHDAAAVLNGGLPAWTQKFPLSRAEVSVTPRKFFPRLRENWTLDGDAIASIRQHKEWVLVDSRTEERYRGQNEPIDPIAGHIPGAVNAPHPENVGSDGLFKEADVLKAQFEAVTGGRPAEKTVFYCGSGVTACRNILAYRVAGLGAARLYPGSWSEWITRNSDT